MAATRRTLTWATPVNYDDLVPALKAYKQVQPLITALLLCNRFGKGEHCSINSLPRELIDMVIKTLIKEELEKQHEEWQLTKACYIGTCEFLKHMDQERYQEEKDCYLECLWETCSQCDGPTDVVICSHVEEKFNEDDFCEYMRGDHEMRSQEEDVCRARKHEYLVPIYKTATGSSATTHFYTEHGTRFDGLLESGFGLRTFISRQHVTKEISVLTGIPERYTYGDWDHRQYRDRSVPEPPRLHVVNAYLTLPYRIVRDALVEDLDTVDNDGFEDDLTVQRHKFTLSAFTIIDPDMLMIDQEKKSRFGRAMNLLGLKPFMSPTQAVSLQARRDRRKLAGLDNTNMSKVAQKLNTAIIHSLAEEVEREEWPKLMNLAATEVDLPGEQQEEVCPRCGSNECRGY